MSPKATPPFYLGSFNTLSSLCFHPYSFVLGFLCIYIYMCLGVLSRSVVSDSCYPIDCSTARLLCSWDSPGKNTGVGCHFLLQGIFLTQESNLGLLHCRQTLYQLNYEGSPYICIYTHTQTYIYIYSSPAAAIGIPGTL